MGGRAGGERRERGPGDGHVDRHAAQRRNHQLQERPRRPAAAAHRRVALGGGLVDLRRAEAAAGAEGLRGAVAVGGGADHGLGLRVPAAGEEEAGGLRDEGGEHGEAEDVGDCAGGEHVAPPAAVLGALDVGVHGGDADEDDEELAGEEGEAREDEDHPAAVRGRGELGHEGDAGGEGDAHRDADQGARRIDCEKVLGEGRPAATDESDESDIQRLAQGRRFDSG